MQEKEMLKEADERMRSTNPTMRDTGMTGMELTNGLDSKRPLTKEDDKVKGEEMSTPPNPTMRETGLMNKSSLDSHRPLTADDKTPKANGDDKQKTEIKKVDKLMVVGSKPEPKAGKSTKIEPIFPSREKGDKDESDDKKKKKKKKKPKVNPSLSRLERYAIYDRHNVDNQKNPAVQDFDGPLSK